MKRVAGGHRVPTSVSRFRRNPGAPDCESNCLGPLATWAYTIKHPVNYPVLHKLREMWPGIRRLELTGKMSDTHFSPISTLYLSNLCVPPCSPSNFFSDLFPRRSRRELLKHRTYRLNKVGCRHRSPMPVKNGRESTMPRTPQQL